MRTAADVYATRDSLIKYIWGDSGFPSRNDLAQVEIGIVDSQYATLFNPAGNLARIDKYVVGLDFGFESHVQHFHPIVPNGKLFVYHSGHEPEGFRQEDRLENNGGQSPGYVIPELIRQGYSVIAFSMPCFGNPIATVHFPGYADIPMVDHWHIIGYLPRPYRFFLEPIAVTLNFVTSQYTYSSVDMIGLSGGGWTTTVYAAIDPRIKRSFPVAGSMPTPYRTTPDIGDAEQYNWSFGQVYNIANYSELYVLGSFGSGRMQVQILNRFDNCCFSGQQHVYWADSVRSAVNNLGEGKYEFYLDETTLTHRISPYAMGVVAAVSTPDVPSAPLIRSPANGAACMPGQDTLDWLQPVHAGKYTIQFSFDSTFSAVVAEDSVRSQSTSNLLLPEILRGHSYYWRVRTSNELGSSPWSDRGRFVVPNDTPTVRTQIPDQYLDEDGGVHVAVADLDSIFKDYGPGLSLSYSVSSEIPEVLVAVVADTLTITSAQDYFGEGTIIITATDSAEVSVRDTVLVVIEPINDPPVLYQLPMVQFVEDSMVVVSLDSLRGYVYDPDDSATSLHWSFYAGQGATAELIGNTVQVTALPNWFGTGTVNVVATDAVGQSDSVFWDVQVSPRNDPPVVSGIPDVTIEEDSSSTLNLNGYVLDPDDSTGSIRWSVVLPEGGTPGNGLKVTIDSTENRVTFSVSRNFSGVDIPIAFTATDLGGLSSHDTMSLQVQPVNDPPSIGELPSVTMSEDDSVFVSFVDWFPALHDPDDPDEAHIWSVTPTAHINVLLSSTGVLLRPVPDWNGTDSMTVIVADGEGLMDTTRLRVHVVSKNDAPRILPIPQIIIVEDSSKILDLTSFVHDVDNTPGEIRWSVEFVDAESPIVSSTGKNSPEEKSTMQAKSEGLSSDAQERRREMSTSSSILRHIEHSVNGVTLKGSKYGDSVVVRLDTVLNTVTFVASGHFWNGYIPIRLTATDPSNLSGSDTTSVSIQSVNDRPVLGDVPVVSMERNTSVFIPYSDWYSYLHDPDNAAPSHVWRVHGQLYTMAVYSDSGITLSARRNWSGEETAYLVATDPHGLRDTTSLTISVFVSAEEDHIVSVPDTVAQVDSLYRYRVRLKNKESGDSTLAYIVNGPAWLSFDSHGTLHGVPTSAGRFDVTIRVLSQSTLIDTQAFSLNVYPVTGVNGNPDEIPASFALHQNYPNPFNPTTTIAFDLPEPAVVSVILYDISGQEVVRIVDGMMSAGRHAVLVDSGSLASGVYLYRLDAGTFSSIKKMLLVK